MWKEISLYKTQKLVLNYFSYYLVRSYWFSKRYVMLSQNQFYAIRPDIQIQWGKEDFVWFVFYRWWAIPEGFGLHSCGHCFKKNKLCGSLPSISLSFLFTFFLSTFPLQLSTSNLCYFILSQPPLFSSFCFIPQLLS